MPNSREEGETPKNVGTNPAEGWVIYGSNTPRDKLLFPSYNLVAEKLIRLRVPVIRPVDSPEHPMVNYQGAMTRAVQEGALCVSLTPLEKGRKPETHKHTLDFSTNEPKSLIAYLHEHQVFQAFEIFDGLKRKYLFRTRYTGGNVLWHPESAIIPRTDEQRGAALEIHGLTTRATRALVHHALALHDFSRLEPFKHEPSVAVRRFLAKAKAMKEMIEFLYIREQIGACFLRASRWESGMVVVPYTASQDFGLWLEEAIRNGETVTQHSADLMLAHFVRQNTPRAPRPRTNIQPGLPTIKADSSISRGPYIPPATNHAHTWYSSQIFPALGGAITGALLLAPSVANAIHPAEIQTVIDQQVKGGFERGAGIVAVTDSKEKAKLIDTFPTAVEINLGQEGGAVTNEAQDVDVKDNMPRQNERLNPNKPTEFNLELGTFSFVLFGLSMVFYKRNPKLSRTLAFLALTGLVACQSAVTVESACGEFANKNGVTDIYIPRLENGDIALYGEREGGVFALCYAHNKEGRPIALAFVKATNRGDYREIYYADLSNVEIRLFPDGSYQTVVLLRDSRGNIVGEYFPTQKSLGSDNIGRIDLLVTSGAEGTGFQVGDVESTILYPPGTPLGIPTPDGVSVPPTPDKLEEVIARLSQAEPAKAAAPATPITPPEVLPSTTPFPTAEPSPTPNPSIKAFEQQIHEAVEKTDKTVTLEFEGQTLNRVEGKIKKEVFTIDGDQVKFTGPKGEKVSVPVGHVSIVVVEAPIMDEKSPTVTFKQEVRILVADPEKQWKPDLEKYPGATPVDWVSWAWLDGQWINVPEPITGLPEIPVVVDWRGLPYYTPKLLVRERELDFSESQQQAIINRVELLTGLPLATTDFYIYNGGEEIQVASWTIIIGPTDPEGKRDQLIMLGLPFSWEMKDSKGKLVVVPRRTVFAHPIVSLSAAVEYYAGLEGYYAQRVDPERIREALVSDNKTLESIVARLFSNYKSERDSDQIESHWNFMIQLLQITDRLFNLGGTWSEQQRDGSWMDLPMPQHVLITMLMRGWEYDGARFFPSFLNFLEIFQRSPLPASHIDSAIVDK